MWENYDSTKLNWASMTLFEYKQNSHGRTSFFFPSHFSFKTDFKKKMVATICSLFVTPHMLNKFVFGECDTFHEEKRTFSSLFTSCIHHPYTSVIVFQCHFKITFWKKPSCLSKCWFPNAVLGRFWSVYFMELRSSSCHVNLCMRAFKNLSPKS